ncbi:MAG: carbonic anhydrase [Nitrospirae bacterium]|nr:carbonic anhydrase [Nitrospirota bacterium]
MKDIIKLLNNNRAWASRVKAENPNFFLRLEKQQRPKYLWIGCSDSRVPANQITGLLPGEVFVHRNISNQVINTDMNLMCVLQYAIEVLQVKHIIVCGHYGCGGIEAVMNNRINGLLEHWLENVKTRMPKQGTITGDRMCELNVIAQVRNLSNNTIVQKAWQKGRDLHIHGWIYSIANGLIKDLKVSRHGLKDVPAQRSR